MLKKILSIIWVCCIFTACSQQEKKPLSLTEKNIITHINANNAEALTLLEKLVNINSGTENIAGVNQVGNIVAKEFEKLGFKSEWKNPPTDMQRAGTLLLTRKGSQGKHLLLIGHLDTVFTQDSAFSKYDQKKNIAAGPGVIDDKGGVVLMFYALKALYEEGALDDTTITVALMGDEEHAGSPVSISRAPLIEAAKGVDVALDFEPAPNLKTATIARRGISHWEITSKGKPAHSSALFQEHIGDGAIFELSRVLNEAQIKLSNTKYITFNPGTIAGGTETSIEKNTGKLEGYGKDNVIAKIARAKGDMRFIDDKQKEFIETTLNEIIQTPLTGTHSQIIFEDRIPAMPPTDNNEKLLQKYSEVSEALGYGPVKAIPPEYRGAADLSYVAKEIPSNLAGLGPTGGGLHTIYETMNLDSFRINTEKAAILIYRLTH